jgi:hypothetical protein
MTKIDQQFVDVLNSIARFIELTGEEVKLMREGVRHLANAMQCMHHDLKALRNETDNASSTGNSE